MPIALKKCELIKDAIHIGTTIVAIIAALHTNGSLTHVHFADNFTSKVYIKWICVGV